MNHGTFTWEGHYKFLRSLPTLTLALLRNHMNELLIGRAVDHWSTIRNGRSQGRCTNYF